MPATWRSSGSCWKQSSNWPRATSSPTSTPGGACLAFALSSWSSPRRWNSSARYTPLGPLEYTIDFAARSAALSASTDLMSGFFAPLRTAAPTPDFAISTFMRESRKPGRMRSSISPDEPITASTTSPAIMRFLMSIMPTHAVAIFCLDRRSKFGATSR